MKAFVFVSMMMIVLLAGCMMQEDTETALEREVISQIQEEQPVEKIVETIVQETADETPLSEEQDILQNPPSETPIPLLTTEKISPVKAPMQRPLDNIDTTPSPLPKLLVHEGKITKVNPVKYGVYSGEITEQNTYRHFPFVSSFLVMRGDSVTFTVGKDDLATVIAKKVIVKNTKATFTRDDAQPEGTVLGTVKKVTTQRSGYAGILHDSTGKEWKYISSFYLEVGSQVYYSPGEEPVTIVKKIEVRRG